jgi:hypothetical protein
MKLRNCTLLITALAAQLMGCQSQPNLHEDLAVVTMQSAQERLNSCVSAIYVEPQFEPIARHMPMNDRGITLDQLADNHFATDEEVGLLSAYYMRTEVCRQAYLTELQSGAPSAARLMSQAFAQNRESFVDLLSKKQSWGAFISRDALTYSRVMPEVMAAIHESAHNVRERTVFN